MISLVQRIEELELRLRELESERRTRLEDSVYPAI
jgi:hypothetical protein